MLYQFLNDLSTPVEKEYLLCESCHMLAANSALCFCENTCENTCVTRGNCPHNERKNISSLQPISIGLVAIKNTTENPKVCHDPYREL